MLTSEHLTIVLRCAYVLLKDLNRCLRKLNVRRETTDPMSEGMLYVYGYKRRICRYERKYFYIFELRVGSQNSQHNLMNSQLNMYALSISVM